MRYTKNKSKNGKEIFNVIFLSELFYNYFFNNSFVYMFTNCKSNEQIKNEEFLSKYNSSISKDHFKLKCNSFMNEKI